MKIKLSEIKLRNVSIDLLETKLIKRASPKRKQKNEKLIWNEHYQTSKFKPDDYFKSIEPSIDKL